MSPQSFQGFQYKVSKKSSEETVTSTPKEPESQEASKEPKEPTQREEQSEAEAASTQEPRRKAKRKASRPSLPPDATVVQVFERSLQLKLERDFANVNDTEREQYQKSVEQVLACLHELSNQQETCYKENSENEALKKREAQLSAIVAKYQEELKLWEELQTEAQNVPIGDVDLPPGPELLNSQVSTNVNEVLATSARVVEDYVLQADHLRTLLKQLENRNRLTQARVREIATSVNNKVLSDLGAAGKEKLVPPTGLTAVRTNDLKVSTLH